MRVPLYQIINDTDEDCFGDTEDLETALTIARSAARERPAETILITYKGFPIKELSVAADGQIAEGEIDLPERVERQLLAAPPAVGKQQ